MKKITSWPIRDNLSYERVYEKKNKVARNTKNKITSNINWKAVRIIEKKIWRKLKKTESVDHIKPLSKGGGNNPSNLRIMSRKENFARWAKLKAKK